MKKEAMVFDLDNCAFHDEWRVHLIDESLDGDEKYHLYHNGLVNDKPNKGVWSIIGKAMVEEDVDVIFLTARPEMFRAMTELKILRTINELFPEIEDGKFEVIMRPNGVELSSPEYKCKVWEEKLFDKYKGGMIYDDRSDVIGYLDLRRNELINYAKKHGCTTEVPNARRAENWTMLRMVAGPHPDGASVSEKFSADKILADASDTFLERNSIYKDNYKMVGRLMEVMFPAGIELRTREEFDKWHLFELLIVKLTRYVSTGLKHHDSIHDMQVYAAMIEAIDRNKEES